MHRCYTEIMKQVLIIHGGESFSTYERYIETLKSQELNYERLKPQKKWKPWIAEQLPEVDVLLPTFPNGNNAVFEEWKIYFEKIIPFFGDEVQLVGHSLGAMFLAKYLNDNPLPQKAKQLILIAGQYGTRENDDLGSFIVTDAKNLSKSANVIHLFYSKDDPVVSYESIHGFEKDLPHAQSHVFDDRGHFLDETFPELLDLLKQK